MLRAAKGEDALLLALRELSTAGEVDAVGRGTSEGVGAARSSERRTGRERGWSRRSTTRVSSHRSSKKNGTHEQTVSSLLLGKLGSELRDELHFCSHGEGSASC